MPSEPLLDQETLAYLQRLADAAPPLSERQKNIISGAFHGAVERQATP